MSYSKKKVGVVGTYGRIDGCSFLSTDNLLNKVGQNTGNLLFQYAVSTFIDEDICVIGTDLPWDAKQVREECRVIVIPSSNFIRENFDFSSMTNFLEDLKLPLVFLGLGAQAKDYDQDEFDFHPSIFKLMKLIKERCYCAGLRGEFTANLLDRFGVTNTSIIGCPTNFLNPDPLLSLKLKEKWKIPIHSFLAAGDEPWPKDLTKLDVERKLVEWVYKGNGIFLQQSVEPFMKYLRQNNPYQDSDVPAHHESSLRKALAPKMTNEEFKSFVATKLRVYFSVDQWLEDSARFDFSVGLRLHGNMAAWQSGTPAIWIYHDSRTRELSETMALPNISHRDFIQFNTIESLRDSLNYCFDHYQKVKNKLFLNYYNIFQQAEIKTRTFD